MRFVCVLILFLFSNLSFSQEHNEQIDLSVLVVPTNRSTLEFYQLGFHHSLSERLSLGCSLNYWKAESKIEFLSFLDTEVSAGVKWHLFPNKPVFIDPNLHAVYHSSMVWPDARLTRGAGLRGGVNAGYDFKRFGIGAMWQTSLFLGRATFVGEIEPPSGVRLFFNFFDYGLYISYRF